MPTKKLLSRFYTTGTRLVILAAMLMAALISSVTSAAAARRYSRSVRDHWQYHYASQPCPDYRSHFGLCAGGLCALSRHAPGGPVIDRQPGRCRHGQPDQQPRRKPPACSSRARPWCRTQVGTAARRPKSYTFTATNPGTFLYEAGLLPNAEHQAAMGLYGALIVRPTSAPDVVIPGQAYADAATTFVDEAVLVLSEIDPALNNAQLRPTSTCATTRPSIS